MIKLLHIIAFMVLVAGLIYSLFCWRKLSVQSLQRLTRCLLAALSFSVGLGLLLVPQKGYFYSTPWIMAAMIFCGVLAVLIVLIYLLQKQQLKSVRGKGYMVVIQGLLALSLLISLAVIHDAVTKTTELVI